jgi:hypothetical protein
MIDKKYDFREMLESIRSSECATDLAEAVSAINPFVILSAIEKVAGKTYSKSDPIEAMKAIASIAKISADAAADIKRRLGKL